MSPRPRIYASAAERQRAYRQRKALRNANHNAIELTYCDDWVTIYTGDCLDVLPTLPEQSIDLIVTSPLYNVGISYISYEDLRPIDEYVTWLEQVARALYRVARPGCRLAWNIAADTTYPTRRFLAAEHGPALERAGWTYRSVVIWNKNAKTGYHVGSKVNPFVLCYCEFVLLLYKETWHRDAPPGASDLTDRELLSLCNGLWTFNGTTQRETAHPAAFPEELAHRCIKLLSLPGDLVLDPFLGSGTTARVAKNLGRRCIGIELDPTYARRAADRCRQDLLLLPEDVNHNADEDRIVTLAGGAQ